jgi:hypothetical protein
LVSKQPTEGNIKINASNFVSDVREMQQHAEERHHKVLRMIEALSETASSDGASSVWKSIIPYTQAMTFDR